MKERRRPSQIRMERGWLWGWVRALRGRVPCGEIPDTLSTDSVLLSYQTTTTTTSNPNPDALRKPSRLPIEGKQDTQPQSVEIRNAPPSESPVSDNVSSLGILISNRQLH